MFVILGCGYIGTRLARAALAAGHPVRACARNTDRLAPLAALGAEVMAFDVTKPKACQIALTGTIGACVVYAVPQVKDLRASEAVSRASQAALEGGARSFIYLGSAGLYGKRPADWEVIDEETAVAHDDAAMAAYHMDEAALQSATAAGLRAIVLRLGPVYGPGRGVRARLRKGDYNLIDDGAHWISRIHVDDLVRVILAADQRAPAGATYLVVDDKPTPQREAAEFLCARLGVPMPPSVPAYGAGHATSPVRGRHIKNDKMKRELELTLLYPSYLEGEAQIEAEESPPAPPAEPPSEPPASSP
jgi:nucleoside-diphosphate-sugar epimerase